MRGQTDLDTAIDALCKSDRRHVVRRLREASKVELSGDQRLQIAMIHNHLPRLAEGDFVEYEQKNDGEIVVKRGDRWNEISHAYEALCEQGIAEAK